MAGILPFEKKNLMDTSWIFRDRDFYNQSTIIIEIMTGLYMVNNAAEIILPV